MEPVNRVDSVWTWRCIELGCMQLGSIISPSHGFHPFWEPQIRKGLRARFSEGGIHIDDENYGNPSTYLNNLDNTAEGEGQGYNDEEAGEQSDK